MLGLGVLVDGVDEGVYDCGTASDGVVELGAFFSAFVLGGGEGSRMSKGRKEGGKEGGWVCALCV